jgi:hypothetical protein
VRWPQLSYVGLSALCSKSGLGHLSRDSTPLCYITGLDRSTAGDRCRQHHAAANARRPWLSRPARVDAVVLSASAMQRFDHPTTPVPMLCGTREAIRPCHPGCHFF